MTINSRQAPHIRNSENTRNIMLDVVLVLLVVYAMAFYFYGPRAFVLGAVGVVTSVAADAVCTLIGFRRVNPRDFSPVITGMILPLLMPATIPYPVVGVAALVAIVAAKQPFGGVGHNVFNPAAAGFSFVAICFTGEIFTYPLPGTWLPLASDVGEFIQGISPAFTLKLGGVPTYDLVEMAQGLYPGPMGATNILVILACLLYLVFRNTVRWEMPVSFFATVALYAYLFPRVDVNGLTSIALESMSGILLIGGVFLLGDPVTTPKRDLSKVIFGVMAGIMVMLFRTYGQMEGEFTFALLLMNAAVWSIDMLVERGYSFVRRKGRAIFSRKKIQKKA